MYFATGSGMNPAPETIAGPRWPTPGEKAGRPPPGRTSSGENAMSLLLIVLIVLLLVSVPVWPHSRGWGYRPSGILGVVLVVLVILLLMGRL
jgi:hypothetical protein